MPSPQKPSPITLVVCENIYLDATGKKALIGLFGRITGPSEGPIVQRRMCIYVSITDIYPGTLLAVDIVHGETDTIVMKAESEPLAPGINPTDILDISFVLTDLSFPEPATYFVRLLGNNEILLQRPIKVVRSKKEKANDDSANK